MTPTQSTQIVLPGPVEPAGLQVRTTARPRAGAHQVVLDMEATGVSFAEQQMRLGTYYDQPRYPFVPGYDLVGTVAEVGVETDPGLVGRRFAAVTKIGAWASQVVVDAGDLVPVPDAVEPAAAAAVTVNGVTAWQMLHRAARVPTGGRIVVLGANGGVGSTLVQLARRAGITVIGTASAAHLDRVTDLGATALDRRDPDLYGRLRTLAPDGVDAVFDHVGGPGLVESRRLVRRGGTLVSYGSAATKGEGSTLATLAQFGRVAWWNAVPDGRRAHFYNLWAGRRRLADFRARMRADLTEVLAMVADGGITPQIAARIPLSQVSAAMELAESHTVVGKVVLVADEHLTR
jgi:NADPH:quinone reductase-like Zn-dependent oxidoreductase